MVNNSNNINQENNYLSTSHLKSLIIIKNHEIQALEIQDTR